MFYNLFEKDLADILVRYYTKLDDKSLQEIKLLGQVNLNLDFLDDQYAKNETSVYMLLDQLHLDEELKRIRESHIERRRIDPRVYSLEFKDNIRYKVRNNIELTLEEKKVIDATVKAIHNINEEQKEKTIDPERQEFFNKEIERINEARKIKFDIWKIIPDKRKNICMRNYSVDVPKIIDEMVAEIRYKYHTHPVEDKEDILDDIKITSGIVLKDIILDNIGSLINGSTAFEFVYDATVLNIYKFPKEKIPVMNRMTYYALVYWGEHTLTNTFYGKYQADDKRYNEWLSTLYDTYENDANEYEKRAENIYTRRYRYKDKKYAAWQDKNRILHVSTTTNDMISPSEMRHRRLYRLNTFTKSNDIDLINDVNVDEKDLFTDSYNEYDDYNDENEYENDYNDENEYDY